MWLFLSLLVFACFRCAYFTDGVLVVYLFLVDGEEEEERKKERMLEMLEMWN